MRARGEPDRLPLPALRRRLVSRRRPQRPDLRPRINRRQRDPPVRARSSTPAGGQTPAAARPAWRVVPRDAAPPSLLAAAVRRCFAGGSPLCADCGAVPGRGRLEHASNLKPAGRASIPADAGAQTHASCQTSRVPVRVTVPC